MHVPVKIYTTTYCGFCRMAKRLLDQKGVEYEEIDVTEDDGARDWLVKTTGRRTVPQVFIGERSVGGFDDLRALEARGALEPMLRPA